MFGQLFIETLQTNPPYFFAVVITVVVSITLHELAHGWVAIKLGDDTPITTGHMTLNPLVHMGVFSIVLLAMAGIAFGAMPVDHTRLRGKYGEALVAAAGPAMNLLLAIVGMVGLGVWVRFGSFDSSNHAQVNGYLLLRVFALYNLALMVFNLLPVPPLDGSWIASNIFPAYRRLTSGEFMQGIMFALIFAMMLGGVTFVFAAAYFVFDKLTPIIAGQPDIGGFFS